MNRPLTPQEHMNAAFENYFELSAVLREDLSALLDSESDSQHWRRNFIRVSASFIEGYVHCLRAMCIVSLTCDAPNIGKKEARVLRSEREFDSIERIKLTLSVAYKLFELQPVPNFGGPEWPRAKCVLEKRHLLMHPKNFADLELPESLWKELRQGVTWLVEQLFNFMAALQIKHST
jgi:hypothetical protein